MNPNSADALNLYAKIEDMLGVAEAAPRLYAYYLLLLEDIVPKTLLDVGCGSGGFISAIASHFEDTSMTGIDLSSDMISIAKEAGVDAYCIDVCEIDGKFDVVTATFDVLNYMDITALKRFLLCVKSHLNPGGYFLCDINTDYGFSEVAVGSFIAEDENRFLAIDSYYDDGLYSSDFTLFEKDDGLYSKASQNIKQYLHLPNQISDISGLELVSAENITLFTDEPDKQFLVLKSS